MNSNLPSFNTTLGLISKTQEIYYVFIFPTILGMGVIFNSMALHVIWQLINKKKLSKSTANVILYKYMFVNELSDLLTCLNASFIILSRCGQYCSIAFTLPVKIYEQYIYTFMGNTYLFWSLLNEISFSIERLRAFSKEKKNGNNIRFRYQSLILFLVSLIVSLPHYIISRNVVPFGVLITTNELLYTIKNNFIATNKFGEIFLFIWALCRGLFLYIVLFILNLIIALKFRKHLYTKVVSINNGKSKIESEKLEKHQRKVTKMLLILTVYFMIGNFPNSLPPLLFFIGFGNTNEYLNFVLFTNTIVMLSHSSFLFIYLIYNQKFRRAFIKIFGFEKLFEKLSVTCKNKNFICRCCKC